MALDNKSIYIIDDFLPKEKIDQFYEHVKTLPFTRFETDDEHDEYPIFSVDFKPDTLLGSYVGEKVEELLSELKINDNLILRRSYVNMSHYGDMGFPHYDCGQDETDITVLYYVNNEWDYTWGGETFFYVDKDPQAVVLPKPGRVVVFPGNIEHLGGIPSRVCKVSRFSLALKYMHGLEL